MGQRTTTPVFGEIRTAIAKMNAGIASGDAGAIAAYYTEDATFLADGAPRIDGRPAVEEFFKRAADAGFNDLQLVTEEVFEAGDRVIEIGRSISAGPGDAGKYVLVWRRDDGALKIEVDIFNSDSRPGQPTASVDE